MQTLYKDVTVMKLDNMFTIKVGKCPLPVVLLNINCPTFDVVTERKLATLLACDVSAQIFGFEANL